MAVRLRPERPKVFWPAGQIWQRRHAQNVEISGFESRAGYQSSGSVADGEATRFQTWNSGFESSHSRHVRVRCRSGRGASLQNSSYAVRVRAHTPRKTQDDGKVLSFRERSAPDSIRMGVRLLRLPPFLERWPSPAYGSGLEYRRSSGIRGFESHPLLQSWKRWAVGSPLAWKPSAPKGHASSNLAASAILFPCTSGTFGVKIDL